MFRPHVDPPDDHDPTTALWFAVCNGEVLLLEEGGLPIEMEAAAEATVFMGFLHERPVWAAGLPGDLRPPGLTNLMALYAQVDEPMWALAGRAVQLVAWDRDHQFCGRCGGPNQSVPGERAKRCKTCRLLVFPRLAPAVITVVTKGGELLLARNRNFPPGLFSALAGFVEPGETIEEAVRREVHEEVGITVGAMRYVASQPWPFPHSLMIGFVAEYESGEIDCDPTEIAEAEWFSPKALPTIPPGISIARKLIDLVVADLAT